MVADILSHMLDGIGASSRPHLVGLSALQGSGKSTLAAQLVAAAKERGMAALALSLDDFYFGRRQRLALAREVHPLLAVRTVPGTHDIALLERTLDALSSAAPTSPARIPRFDKGTDTRLPPSRWRTVRRRPQLVVLEGWCVGVGAQEDAALREPLNALEREHDADRRWRRFVNAQLGGDYARLWQRIDHVVLLRAPAYEVVRRWREEQERGLRRRGAARAMSPAQVRRFLEFAERLSRHALASLPERANLVVALDEERRVTAVRPRIPRAASRAPAGRY
ncbi:D-glycerate 3-kinase [Dokdonella immobilis]|uniref:D-glycerate 3-kinase n=1 Tax=Dokdonella immobilis TaxID=578942 RepID=A0A1I4WC47_9GAMM|nr:D-glycerate 3-kinase [Dokdonella immobilis]